MSLIFQNLLEEGGDDKVIKDLGIHRRMTYLSKNNKLLPNKKLELEEESKSMT